jgi:hypothetical protein
VSNVGFTVCTPENFDEIKVGLAAITHFKSEQLLRDLDSLVTIPPKPVTEVKLPDNTRSLRDRFGNVDDLRSKVDSFYQTQNMNYQKQLIIG